MKVDEVSKTSIIQSNEVISRSAPRKQRAQDSDFQKAFQQVLGSSRLKFSNHALQRMSRRGVDINGQTVTRLDNAVTAANEKGAGQSLVLLDEMAFLVSVKNRTVITAMETSKMKQGIITRIDSAIIG